jgi:hypothetical protein
MARYRFQPGKEYPARLLAVRVRPIANEDSRVRLLRLEFEIFPEFKGQLRSQGKIACRDLVIGPESARDTGVSRYARALGVHAEDRVEDWLAAEQGAPWVRIVFGEPDPEDDRSPFDEFEPFDLEKSGCRVVEYDLPLGEKWVTPAEAADELGCSTATVRRRVDQHQAEWGTRLVRVTPGGHRRINLPLLREVESEDQIAGLRTHRGAPAAARTVRGEPGAAVTVGKQGA